MAIFKRECSNCGASIDRNVRFCPECGAAQASGKVKCGDCGQDMPSTARFCPSCGHEMTTARPPQIADNRWRRGEEDFATRVIIDDVRGFFAREVIVEPGTQAIILADGANLGVVGPGKYTLDTLIERGAVFLNLRSAHRVEAILIDVDDTDLQFHVPRLFTADPLEVSVACRVVTRVGNPLTFLRTLMKTQRRYGLEHLRDYLYVEIEEAAREWISPHSVEDMGGNLRLKEELELAIDTYVRRTMERIGLELVQVRALDLTHPYEEKVTGVRAEAFIAAREAEEQFAAERGRLDRERVARGLVTQEEVARRADALAQRKTLDEIYSQEEQLTLIEETRQVVVHEERAGLWERMRRSVLSDRMAELRTEAEMEAFLREQDTNKLLSEKEWQELQRTIQEEQQDHQVMRAHLAAKAQLEHGYELRQVDLLQRSDMDESQLKFEQALARRELDGRLDLERQRWEFELTKREREAEFERQQRRIEDADRRERELQGAMSQRDIELAQAKSQAEINRLQREQDQADAELGLLLLERMKEIKRRDQMERDLHQLDVDRQRLEIELKAEVQRLEMQLRSARQEHELVLVREQQEQTFELDRIKLLSQASAEAVISLSGNEQARVIADLKQTETFKGMTDAQVEAIMATRSPELAQALAERWKAIEAGKAPGVQAELYERMLSQQAESDKRVEGALRESLVMQQRATEMQQETGLQGMRIVQETASAFAGTAGRSESPTVIVTPGASGPVVTPLGGFGLAANASGRAIVCPRCHLESPVGVKYCQNCGHGFFGTSPEEGGI